MKHKGTKIVQRYSGLLEQKLRNFSNILSAPPTLWFYNAFR